MKTLRITLLVTLVAFASAKERCCPGLACYTDDPPFEDMPLPECPEQLQLSMRVYTRDNQAENEGQVITRTTIPPAYNARKKTVVITHGWLGDKDQFWMHEAKDAILQKHDYNVIITGWSEGSIRLWYPQSASNTRTVGGEMGLVVKNLIKKERARPEDFWCIGHSLGGHTCGHMGKLIHIGRITALDPAGPWFEDKDATKVGVYRGDADFVDIWHTNGQPNIILNLGTMKVLGHVDFYPNGGGLQPGCILDPYAIMNYGTLPEAQGLIPACSHLKVVFYLVEALKGPCKFSSRRRCSNANDLPNSCTTSEDVVQVMGAEAIDYQHGIYHLDVNEEAPYCKG